MNCRLWIHAVSIVLFTALSAFAQTNWPDFMGTLKPGASVGPAAGLLADTTITPPDPEVPFERARWSGKWTGWACEGKVCDTKLAVEKVTAEGATIVYAVASNRVKPFSYRFEANLLAMSYMQLQHAETKSLIACDQTAISISCGVTRICGMLEYYQRRNSV
jgi:hypothetical protein